MGNALNISSCFNTSSTSNKTIMLVFFEGTTTTLKGKHIAGEIMFQNPDKIVCDADSFFIGRPLPSLSIEDQLSPGRTYFVLPIDTFSNCSVLSATSLSAFSSTPSNMNPNSPIKFGKECPFHYIKGQNGRVLIKVLPEFIIGLIHSRAKQCLDSNFVISGTNGVVSTPELKKHYDQLVRPKDHSWSPNLHTISEKKIRYSPCRKLLGFGMLEERKN